jgi:hypothetical protein
MSQLDLWTPHVGFWTSMSENAGAFSEGTLIPSAAFTSSPTLIYWLQPVLIKRYQSGTREWLFAFKLSTDIREQSQAASSTLRAIGLPVPTQLE